MSTKRRSTESYDDYKARCKAEASTERTYLRGVVVHESRRVLVLKTQAEVDAANQLNQAAHFKLFDTAVYRNTLRNPPKPKLSKDQRRRLRKIVNNAAKAGIK